MRREGAYEGLLSALRASGDAHRGVNAKRGERAQWRFGLVAGTRTAEIRDIFDYVSVEGDVLDIGVVDSGAPADDDDGYGFFDGGTPGAPETATTPGYGFFDDAPGAP